METLEEWSEKKFNTVLFDSDTDGEDYKLFHSRILEHSSHYFIVIDTNGNVFGHYYPSMIDKIWDYEIEGTNDDNNIFMFTLKNKENSGSKRFMHVGNHIVRTYMMNGGFWSVRGDHEDGYSNCNFGSSHRYRDDISNYVDVYINKSFGGATSATFTGGKEGENVHFASKRLIVVEMG